MRSSSSTHRPQTRCALTLNSGAQGFWRLGLPHDSASVANTHSDTHPPPNSNSSPELVFHSVYQPFCYLGITIYAAGVTIRQALATDTHLLPPSHGQNNPSTYLHRRDEATASPAGHYLTPRVTRWVITAFSYLPAYCLIIEEECVCVSVWETHYLAMQASQVDRLILPSITALWMQLHAEEVGSVLRPVVAPVNQVDVHVSTESLQSADDFRSFG